VGCITQDNLPNCPTAFSYPSAGAAALAAGATIFNYIHCSKPEFVPAEGMVKFLGNDHGNSGVCQHDNTGAHEKTALWPLETLLVTT